MTSPGRSSGPLMDESAEDMGTLMGVDEKTLSRLEGGPSFRPIPLDELETLSQVRSENGDDSRG